VDGVGVGRTTMALPPLVLHAETERDATTVSVHKMGATGCREIATRPPLEEEAFACPEREPSVRLPRHKELPLRAHQTFRNVGRLCVRARRTEPNVPGAN
jgi:hypothetical protein